MVPLFKLQDLQHGWQDAHAPLVCRGEDQVSDVIRQETTKLENLNVRRAFQDNSSLFVLFKRRNRLPLATHDELCCLFALDKTTVALPVARVYRKDESNVIVWIQCEEVRDLLRSVAFWNVTIAGRTCESVDARVRQRTAG